MRECRDADLTPTFLRFKLSNHRLRSSTEVSHARRKLLRKEIQCKQRLLDMYAVRLSELRSDLRRSVRSIDFAYYIKLIEENVEKHELVVKRTHQRKLTSLRARIRQDRYYLNPDSVITNLSSYILSDVEKSALSRGLDFTLPLPKLKMGNYLSDFELLHYSLSSRTFSGSEEDKLYVNKTLADIGFSSYFNFNSSRNNLLNLPKEEYDALLKLSKNEEIIVTSPDKGSGVVILSLIHI